MITPNEDNIKNNSSEVTESTKKELASKKQDQSTSPMQKRVTVCQRCSTIKNDKRVSFHINNERLLPDKDQFQTQPKDRECTPDCDHKTGLPRLKNRAANRNPFPEDSMDSKLFSFFHDWLEHLKDRSLSLTTTAKTSRLSKRNPPRPPMPSYNLPPLPTTKKKSTRRFYKPPMPKTHLLTNRASILREEKTSVTTINLKSLKSGGRFRTKQLQAATKRFNDAVREKNLKTEPKSNTELKLHSLNSVLDDCYPYLNCNNNRRLSKTRPPRTIDNSLITANTLPSRRIPVTHTHQHRLDASRRLTEPRLPPLREVPAKPSLPSNAMPLHLRRIIRLSVDNSQWRRAPPRWS